MQVPSTLRHIRTHLEPAWAHSFVAWTHAVCYNVIIILRIIEANFLGVANPISKFQNSIFIFFGIVLGIIDIHPMVAPSPARLDLVVSWPV